MNLLFVAVGCLLMFVAGAIYSLKKNTKK
ncbi:hypothetical protein P7E02_14855 [Enterococcus hulanensis]|nr:hypothetical protein [Enterococcus hulanensis]MDT2661152.1 hypothetical protein [Enterococcus hulanensis]